MSKNVLEEPEKKYGGLSNQEDENDDEYCENTDIESEKNKIVEYSPKGRFIRFNEELGSGAYKTVYKAYDNETGWEVAWNVIRLQRLPDKERKRISDEIALLKQLKHPNIIHFISAWINRQKEEVIFITEAVTGGSLKRYLKKIKSPRLKVIKTWCREILNGIEYLHSLEPHPIIHRDIKCDNIFINSNKGEIRIGDLGLATFMSHAFAESVLGTPEFMAPEMYDEVYGPSVDIYSFGMCLLEMVTNRTPYEECMNPAQIYRKVSKGIKPNSLNMIGNEEVKNFIIECLKPKDERPTANDLLKHEFLALVDGELDNQPVTLIEALPMSKIDELNSTKGSVITMRKDLKSYASSILDNENNKESREKELREKENKDKIKQLSPDSGVEKERLDDKSRPPQQQIYQEEVKREEINQENDDNTQRNEHVSGHIANLEDKSSRVLIRQATSEKQTPDSTPKGQEKPKELIGSSKQSIKEEKQSLNHDTQAQEESNIAMENKEANKYYFVSKGMNNKYLAIAIRKKGPENVHEQIVKIPKEKISADKIKRKLFKQINCQNPNDLFFLQSLNSLFENLVCVGILSPNGVNVNTNPQKKPFVNDAHNKSPEKHFVPSFIAPVLFQSKYFAKFYKKYLKRLPSEYLLLETEEAMNLRHQREMLELENIHLMQKRNMWDRRQSIMSNNILNGWNGNTTNFNTFDPDDCYHKYFQINDVTCRSEIKNKESRCTDFTTPSVGSAATLSPASCSGAYTQCFNNWIEANSGNIKREELSHASAEEIAKLPLQNFDNSGDTDKSSSVNTDSTPIAQLNFQLNLGNLNISNNAGQANANAMLSAKHVASSFAIHASKSNPVKTQSDKSGIKEKKNPEFALKEELALTKRSSIERNLENSQNLAQSLLQNEPQNPVSLLQNGNNGQNIQLHTEAEKGNGEHRPEIKKEKLNINVNLLSAADKVTLSNQNSATLPKPQQKIQEPVAKNIVNMGKICSAPTNLSHTVEPPLDNSNSPNGHNGDVGTSSVSHKSSVTTVSNPTSTSNLTSSNTISQGHTPINNNAQNTQKTLTQQSSAGNLQIKPTELANGAQSEKQVKSSLPLQSNQQVGVDNNSKNVVKLDTIPHSTHGKLQSIDLFEKIKNYKLSGVLRREEPEMSHDDVKMLQVCLELLTESDILPNGHFSHYTENLIKSCQESIGVTVTGVVDNIVWEKMIGKIRAYSEVISYLDALDKKMEKKLAKGVVKQEGDREREEIKRKMKDKQNKEASECMSKIQSNLIDLSDLK